MRVVAGSLGGRRLVAPSGRATRPTSDRVREALFSMLGPLEGETVLDLFAGSGALGIEALSRGAGTATLVDVSAPAVAVIRRNLEALGLEAEAVRASAAGFLRRARAEQRQYDLVFLDPPYARAHDILDEIAAPLQGVLAPGARIVCESSRRRPLALGWPLRRERIYGETLIRIYDA